MAHLEVAVDKLNTTAFEEWEGETYRCGVMRPLRARGHSASQQHGQKLSFCLFPIYHPTAINFYKQKYKIYNRHLVSPKCSHKLIPMALL